MKLNYSFSKREIALILGLILVLMGLLYYRFVYMEIGSQIEQYDTTDLEAQVQMEQLQLIKWQAMQDEIEEFGKVSTSSLKTYDNQKEEINLLNDIFEPCIRYNFSFEKPVATGDTIRRNVAVSFTTIDYASALEIIVKLHNSEDRVLIRDISITAGDLTVDYLTALATEALSDPKALNQLKKQVNALLSANLEVDPYVMKVYNGEPLTEAAETEQAVQTAEAEGLPGMEGAEGEEVPQETTPEEGVIFEDGSTEGMPEGEAAETVETLEDGTVVAPRPEIAEELAAVAEELQSESETETEKPIQTLENSLANVSMTMTFYETAYGAENLDGLIIENVETPVEE